MPSPKYLLIILGAAVLGCGSEPPPKPPDALVVFPNLPLPPNAQFVSRAGGADALQITLFSPAAASGVTEYYRQTLSKGKWRLLSDVKKPDGSIVLYAEQDGPPMWVRIWPTSDGAGTMVELAGAVIRKDSTQADQPEQKAASKPRS
jgi:hypothetical protein